MKIIIDENVSAELSEHLTDAGHHVVHIAGSTLKSSSDQEVYQYFVSSNALFITRDYHFTNPVRFPVVNTKGIIYIRHGNHTSREEIKLVTQFIKDFSHSVFKGKLVKLSKTGVTFR